MTTSAESFGQWVRARRKDRNLTQKGLGRLVGYAEITVRQIEHDTYSLTRFVVESMVNCLAEKLDNREAIVIFALRQSSTGNLLGQSGRSHLSTTPFFGRESELAHIHALLHDSDCRCISLVGLGGIGKTRLALRAIDLFVGEMDQAAWIVNLAGVETVKLLPQAIADALDIALVPFATPVEQVLQVLQSNQMLLLLDNFEHLLPDGIGFVLAILERAPRVKLLITSRERLRVTGESCVQLDGLDTSDRPSMSEAAQLFVKTAQRINNQFIASETGVIQEICQLVQGIPLAIEMAASWTEVYACHEILANTSAHVLGLTTRQRDIDARHRTLQTVFETSWVLLSPVEQATLKKLTVFRGGFTVDAARRVAAATTEILAFLQDKMLIQPQDNGRLDLHEMIHQFASEKLGIDESELFQAQLSHAEYYVEMLRQSLPGLKYHHTRQEIAQLSPEIDNLRLVWDTILQKRKVDWFLDSWESLQLLYNITSRFQVGEETFRLAAAAFNTTAAQWTESFIHAFSQIQLAIFLFRQGRIQEACAVQFAPDIQVVRDSSNTDDRFWVHATDSFLYHGVGNSLAALNSAELALNAAGKDPLEVASTYFLLGRGDLLNKDFASAYRHLSESVRICRECGLDWAISLPLTELGLVEEEENRLPEALRYYENALFNAALFEDLWSYQRVQISIGRIQMTLGQVEKAIDTQLTALRAMTRNPVIGLEIDNFVEIAQILIHFSELSLAAVLLELCASHPECFQPTRNRAMQYLTALKTDLPDLDLSVARNLLPVTKSEIATLLISRLTQIQFL